MWTMTRWLLRCACVLFLGVALCSLQRCGLFTREATLYCRPQYGFSWWHRLRSLLCRVCLQHVCMRCVVASRCGYLGRKVVKQYTLSSTDQRETWLYGVMGACYYGELLEGCVHFPYLDLTFL